MALRPTLDRYRWRTGRLFSTSSLLQVQQTPFFIRALGYGRRRGYLCTHMNLLDTLDRTVGDKRHVVTVELAVTPVDILSAGGTCQLAFTEEMEAQLSAETKEAVQNGVNSAYLQGMC